MDRPLWAAPFLHLENTLISDSALEQLALMTELKELSFDNIDVSAAALKKLRQATPNCEISSAPIEKNLPA